MLYQYRNSYFDKDIKILSNKELYQIGKVSGHWVNLPAKCSNLVYAHNLEKIIIISYILNIYMKGDIHEQFKS